MPSDILRCSICPKRPRFSDVSHLLTHISSKGHLSHYFKLQVRSHQEPEAVELLAAYDTWYNENNLAGLLSERMRAKEAKKARGSNAGGGNRTVTGVTGGKNNKDNRAVSDKVRLSGHDAASLPARNAFTTSTIIKNAQYPSRIVVDPRLSQAYPIPGNHCQPYHGSPSSQALGTVNGSLHQHKSYMQAPPGWPLATLPPQRPTQLGPRVNRKLEPSSEPEEDPESPLAQRSHSSVKSANRRSIAPSLCPRRPVTPDPFVDDDASFEYDDEEEEENDDETTETRLGEESARLKGILWPGMDIFDAATEQMRRKRNQKKDGSILKQMEKTSESVEPTELVFSPGGTLRKERFISGMVEDSSPLKGETPIPKTRIPKRRRPPPPPPSINSSLNALGPQQANNGERRRKPSQREHRQLSRRQNLPFLESPTEPHSSYTFGNYVSPDSSDYRFAYTEQSQRPGSAFTVFNDETKQLASFRGGEALSDATNIARSSNNHFDPFMDADSFPNDHQLKGLLHQGSKYRSGFPPGKENIDPILSQFGRNDMRESGMTWGGQQFAASSPQYTSSYSYGTGYQAGFIPFADSDAFGYPYNPLSYQFGSQPQTVNGRDIAPSHELFVSPDHKPVIKGEQDASPNETLSDMDREDIGRLYLATISG
ncbi:hypothetical protein VTO42DRAFT_4609 [Malbranchea cinnamomea]